MVFIYSPIGIGIRNDFDPTGTTSSCPAEGTRGKYHYSSTASSTVPTACTKCAPSASRAPLAAHPDTLCVRRYQEGCETVLLVDQDKLGFGNQTDSRRTGCDRPENQCTNFVVRARCLSALAALAVTAHHPLLRTYFPAVRARSLARPAAWISWCP